MRANQRNCGTSLTVSMREILKESGPIPEGLKSQPAQPNIECCQLQRRIFHAKTERNLRFSNDFDWSCYNNFDIVPEEEISP